MAVLPRCVYCLPARAERDELAGAMLVQLLHQQGFGAATAPGKLSAGELLSLVEKADVDVVCISVVAPSTIIHARYLCKKLRTSFPKVKIIIGLWGATENITEATGRLRDSGADEVVVSLAEALKQIAKLRAAARRGDVTGAHTRGRGGAACRARRTQSARYRSRAGFRSHHRKARPRLRDADRTDLSR